LYLFDDLFDVSFLLRSKVFLAEITLKDEQLNKLQQEIAQLEENICKTEEANEKIKKNILQLKALFGDVLKQLSAYKKELENLKTTVKVHYKGILDYSQGITKSVAELCEDFAKDYENLKQTLIKVSFMYILCEFYVNFILCGKFYANQRSICRPCA
jgi:septal ring factor EnvC (AmiA/AmiB activator)